MKVQRLLAELEQLLDVYERELGSMGAPLPEEIPALEAPVREHYSSPSRREQLMGRMKALPVGVKEAWDEITDRLSESVRRHI